MNTEKILKVLAGEKASYDEKKVAAYIVWQLQHMSNRDLAEKTAEEIEKGKFNKEDLWDNIKEAAISAAKTTKEKECLCVDDSVVYGWVREYLSIDGAVSDAEAKGFVYSETEAVPEAEKTSDAAIVDINALLDF